ncbi:MAG: HAMP domain-containing histidine kinase [Firmicutes bacterium]|nr:HAMP domain-containing histidine kinase [Bacillota bacterium]
MNNFLLFIVVILIIIVILQHKAKKERDKNLLYIKNKIYNIIDNDTSEKLLVVTDDKQVKYILKEINNLLEYNQKCKADYKKTKESMKKMLSNISHDLKTPLTVILGYIETIQNDTTLTDKEKQLLISKVQNKTMELIELINKFFNLAKLESGDNHIKLTRINLNEVCNKNILSFYDVINNKGLKIKINIPKEQYYVLGNEEVLDRIFNNLISNAIKYGYEGKIIGIGIRDDHEYVYVDVWDRGKGIKDHNDKVFERLYTLEDSRNKSYQGSGLGLTITKRLIETLGGEIFLHSKPFEKTTFTIKLKKMNY